MFPASHGVRTNAQLGAVLAHGHQAGKHLDQ